MNYCDPKGFRSEIKALREKGRDIFFSWMDGGETADGAFEKAEDVFTRLMLPSAKKYLKKLDDKVSLDIGYGSGGQVLAATMYFDKAYGLDVHEESDFVEEELKNRGAHGRDFHLITGDGNSIPLPDGSVDFVHSWVTFMHLGTVDNTVRYLKEMFRVMKEGAVAVIFFSRMLRSALSQTWEQVLEDIKKEEEGAGYREGGPKTRVRGINIQMTMWKMKELVEAEGFDILDITASSHIINRRKYFFGQYGVIIRKPTKTIKRTLIRRRSGNK